MLELRESFKPDSSAIDEIGVTESGQVVITFAGTRPYLYPFLDTEDYAFLKAVHEDGDSVGKAWNKDYRGSEAQAL